jgi:hypothetical protein
VKIYLIAIALILCAQGIGDAASSFSVVGGNALAISDNGLSALDTKYANGELNELYWNKVEVVKPINGFPKCFTSEDLYFKNGKYYLTGADYAAPSNASNSTSMANDTAITVEIN